MYPIRLLSYTYSILFTITQIVNSGRLPHERQPVARWKRPADNSLLIFSLFVQNYLHELSHQNVDLENPHSPDVKTGIEAYASGMTRNMQQRRKDDIHFKNVVEVLICDDDPHIQEALKSLLSAYAFSKPNNPAPEITVVGEASDGLEALRLVAIHQPDVILMDEHMPVMDGFETTRAIKASCPQVKVVMLTIDAAQEQAAMASGVDAFLLKGCPAEKIIETILKTSKPDNEHA